MNVVADIAHVADGGRDFGRASRAHAHGRLQRGRLVWGMFNETGFRQRSFFDLTCRYAQSHLRDLSGDVNTAIRLLGELFEDEDEDF